MTNSKDKNERFDKRAAALRANLSRRKQVKRDTADGAEKKPPQKKDD